MMATSRLCLENHYPKEIKGSFLREQGSLHCLRHAQVLGLEKRSPLIVCSGLSLPESPRARQGMVLTMYPAAPSIFYSAEGSGLDKFSLLLLVCVCSASLRCSSRWLHGSESMLLALRRDNHLVRLDSQWP